MSRPSRKRVSAFVSDELFAEIERLRGDQARDPFIRDAIARGLGLEAMSRPSSASPRVRSSADAKAGVRPIPRPGS